MWCNRITCNVFQVERVGNSLWRTHTLTANHNPFTWNLTLPLCILISFTLSHLHFYESFEYSVFNLLIHGLKVASICYFFSPSHSLPSIFTTEKWPKCSALSCRPNRPDIKQLQTVTCITKSLSLGYSIQVERRKIPGNRSFYSYEDSFRFQWNSFRNEYSNRCRLFTITLFSHTHTNPLYAACTADATNRI